MAHFHGGAHAHDHATEAAVPRNTRIGLWLFAFYLALYAGYVLLNAFQPAQMERELISGVNIAVGYGVALIVVAIVLALIYVWVCQTAPTPEQPPLADAEDDQ